MKLVPPAILLALSASAPALAAGQLPRGVVPVSYDITVRPDARALTFTGSEDVAVDVREPTRTLVLNGANLQITRAAFDGRPASARLDEATQLVTVTLPAEAKPGRHTVSFGWTGVVNRSAAGLFAIDYTNTDGSPARMLATQFEAPDARRFAPMWDEPSFKARFRLTAVAPRGQLAFSNMPAESVTSDGAGAQTYRFGQTPVMSSYLLFLGMGDMERRTVTAGPTDHPVEIGVITRRGVSDQGGYALQAAARLLSYYDEYFGQPYPLPKMDMIAGPGSSQFFGAMENWGAIFYFENELLFDPARATESARQRIHTVVAHEMAHQWFGDLVTMAWWDDLWLNEGFASWMENKASNDLNPAWRSRAAAVSGTRENAMALDATAGTHPIIRHVETVDQIGEAFDQITYQKGQAVIGMLETTIGPDAFRDGIRRYMARYKYGNTATDQLWAELSAAAGRPIADIAHDFTLKAGVPLVTVGGVACAGGRTTATLAQGRFGLDAASRAPATWRVPLVVGVVGGAPMRTVVQGAGGATVQADGCGTLVVNRGQGGYARVRYDDAAHAALVRDYSRLALEDRLGVMGDDFALAGGGYQPLSRWTALVDRMGADAEPLQWSMLAGELKYLNGLYGGDPLAAPLRARTVALLGPVFRRVGLEVQPGESPLTTNLRETLIEQLGAAGDPALAARARAYVAALRADPTAIPPAIRQPILSTFAVNATPGDWDALLALTDAEKSPVAKNRFVTLLGSSRDEGNARRALALLKTDRFTPPQRAELLHALGAAHPDLAFDWAVANQALVNGFLEESSRSRFIAELGDGSGDPAMPGKIDAYARANLPEGSRGPAARAVAAIGVRRAAADRLRPGVAAWVGRRGN